MRFFVLFFHETFLPCPTKGSLIHFRFFYIVIQVVKQLPVGWDSIINNEVT